MSEARAFLFPYCIKQLEDGRYIVLNRNYKPLGVQSGDWVVYEEHPSAINLEITKSIAEKLSWVGEGCTDTIYLYNDGCIPTDAKEHMNAYLKRLSVLAAVKLKKG